jgi:hypothetical protein
VFTIDVTECDFTGTVLGSVNLDTALDPAVPRDLTFKFSPALSVTTVCSSGKKTVAFAVRWSSGIYVSDSIYADTIALTRSCLMQRTTTVAAPLGADDPGEAFAVTIDAE